MRLVFKAIVYLLLFLCVVAAAHGQATSESAPTRPELNLRLGHADLISGLAVSPDGRQLATASYDRTVRLWDLQSGAELGSLKHATSVKAVTFLNNNQVVTGTSDGTLLVWDLQSGHLQRSAKVGSSIDQLFASPDGGQLWCTAQFTGVFALNASTLVVIAHYSNDLGVAVARTVRTDGAYCVVRWSGSPGLVEWIANRAVVEWWRGSVLVEAGKTYQVEKRITSAVVASDGLTLLLGTDNGMVHQLRGPKLTERVSYAGHRGAVVSVDLAPDCINFVSVGRTDNIVLVRSVDTGSQIRKIVSPHGAPDRVLFTGTSDQFLVANGELNSARLLSISTGQDLSFGRTATPVFKIQSSRDHRHLLTGTWYRAHLWDLATGLMTNQFALSGSASAITINPDGKAVFTGEDLPRDLSKYLLAKDIRTGKEIGRYPHQANVTAAVYSPDRRWLATGETTGTIHLWSTDTGLEVRTMVGHSQAVTGLVFGPDKDTLLSHSQDNTARVWNLQTGEERWREDAHGHHSEVFSPDGGLLAAWKGNLRIFDVKTHTELINIDDTWANFTFADSNTLLFVNESRSTIESWDSARRVRKEVAKVRDPETVTILPLPGTQALACENGTATVVDWAKGQTRHTFQNAGCSSSFVPFVFVENAGRYEVWNAATNTRRSQLQEGSDLQKEESFAVSADGRFMVTTNSDFVVKTWDLNSGRRLRQEEDSYRRFDSLRTGLPALAANRNRYFVGLENDEPPQSAINKWTIEPESRPRRLFTQFYASSLDVSPDGKRLLTCAGDSSLRLTNAQNGKALAHREDTKCQKAKFNQDGTLITVNGLMDDGLPQVWTADLLRRLPGFDYRPADVKRLAVSEDGGNMLTVEGSGKLRFWDLRTGVEKLVFSGGGDQKTITAVELLIGGMLAVAARDTGEIQSWMTSAGGPAFKYNGHTGRILLLRRALNDDRTFLSAGEDGSVRVWEATKTEPVLIVEGRAGGISTATLSADSSLLLVAGSDASIRIWNVESGQLLHTYHVPKVARAVSFSPDKTSFIFGADDGLARVVKVEDGRIDRELRITPSESISSVEYLGTFIITTTSSRTILWSEKGERLDEFTAGAPLTLSRTFVDSQRNVIILQAGTGVYGGRVGASLFAKRKIFNHKVFSEGVSSLAASPEGRRVAVAYSTGWLRIWDVASQSMVIEFRVGESSISALKYSSDGKSLLLTSGKGTLAEWDASSGKILRTYPESFDVTDLAFAGAADKFVIRSSSDGRVSIFDRGTGIELCSLLSWRNGEWLVVRSDGLFDGTEAAVRSAIGRLDKPTAERHRPGLLADIIHGRIPPPAGALAGPPVLPPGKQLRFDSPESPAIARTEEAQGPSSPALEGQGLQIMVELFAHRLGAKDRLTVNDGLRVETSPDGRIVVGTRALEHLFKDQSYATSVGLTAFIVAHEVWHSRQAPKYRFGELSEEDRRLLECQADVLGTIDAIEIVMAFGGSRHAVDAYAAIMNFPESVSAMTTLEGSDSSHPTKLQRQWAVEFGKARLAARVLKDKDTLMVFDRRFDAGRPGDDEIWAQSVCKRLLNFSLASERDVSVVLRNERRFGHRWEGEVVYRNVSGRRLNISAHMRLVGTSFSLLTGKPSSAAAVIDGYLTTFTLAAGEERTQFVSLASIDLPGERFEVSGILYSSLQHENWMSVEIADGELTSPDTKPTAAQVQEEQLRANVAGPTTCVQAVRTGILTQRQNELGAFLFRAAAHAVDGFQSLRRGNPIILGRPAEKDKIVGYEADIQLPAAQDAMIIVNSNGEVALTVTLGSRLAQSEADELFKTTSDHLRALCPNSVVNTKSVPREIALESLVIPEFARNVEVSLERLDFKRLGTSEVKLTMRVKKGKQAQ